MKDPELDILIEELETQADMPIADFAGAVHALRFLLPGQIGQEVTAERISTTDGALLVADDAYPNWAVSIHGRANDRDGHWRCSLRENDARDNDEAIGIGRSPVLAQAILAAVLRLSMIFKKDTGDD
ncbi:hypothetical protein GCM10016455_01580 [Aliiroseovarius zhejiangensis]|uniref:DUF2793 domain-containing protein n=1 Tax=Aliiroseovarius zhejiangensis TaxID=1632025 RepID=A0ABQ3IP41_9RHOB|nr:MULTISPECIES: hypothetical protein [Aliiroseovarius]MCK8483924.1 hypothetical protein [Aliiroseovarius sp. S2029]GHE85952.1 hypothetical protein GCM10016455_01580 [Aliiroseovarius zhejiangensis]